ncbi:MAG: 5'-nucleotidase C-terminal domain-containing protein [Bacteroidales bacterium]|jgi:5''-nucleotidase/2'',3''-cyclic phosphodiesterase and related esterases|nr:5'-nucleotidase C-terminal domain-containing protein [Bacteroidales bacterium]
MKRFIILLTASLLAFVPAGAFGFRWKQIPVDASRTGVTCPSADNVPEAMGRMSGRKYVAPNGRVFKGSSVTAKVARLMLDAQPGMASVKEVIGVCPTGLERGGDESLLGDWAVDILMSGAEKEFGRKVDIGVLNHGGIRIDMPQGEVLMDDLMSMFPFKNYLSMVTMKGTEVKALFDRMGRRPQVVGGVKLVVKDGQVLELLVGGEPVDDDRIYNVATIDFLLSGGDGIFGGREFVETFNSEQLVFDVMLDHVRELTAAGKPIAKERDGRVDDLTERKRRD